MKDPWVSVVGAHMLECDMCGEDDPIKKYWCRKSNLFHAFYCESCHPEPPGLHDVDNEVKEHTE